MVNLTLAVVVINGWNRLAVGFRSQPGAYQSNKQPIVASSSTDKTK